MCLEAIAYNRLCFVTHKLHLFDVSMQNYVNAKLN